MNKQLQDFARAELKTGLAELPEENHRTFKLMYARDNGKRSVVDAVAMQINDVVDLMPPEQLDWAMQQVQASLDKMHNASYTSILTPKMPPCFGRVNTHGDGERDGETRSRNHADMMSPAVLVNG